MEKPTYYAIIPANVRYDTNLSSSHKLLYGEITCLTQSTGKCFASNAYFAELYNVSRVSISKWINELIKFGYIRSEIVYKEGSKEIDHRYLSLVNDPIKEKFNTPIKEKFKDNNTSINNTSLIKEKINKKKIFSFSLSNKQSYDNLSQEYKDKLKAKCLLTDGNLQRYNDFIDQLEAKGYQYKDFSKAYIVWDKEKKYQSFTPEPEPKLGDDWVKVVTGYDTVIAINTKTLETKEGVLKR